MRRERNAFAILAALLAGCASEPGGVDAGSGLELDAVSPEEAGRGVPDAVERPDGVADTEAPRPCDALPGPPSWAETRGLNELAARGTGRDVLVSVFDDGFVRLRYVDSEAEFVGRAFSTVEAPVGLPARFEVAHDAASARATICTDRFTIRLERDGGRVRVEDLSGRTLLEDLPEPSPRGDRVVRSSPRDELFLGLGERTGRLDRRGRRLVMRNTDAYDARYGGYAPDADPLYQSIPLFVGVREGARPEDDFAYGLFTDVTYRLDFDLAASAEDRYAIDSTGPELDQWLIEGPTPREVLRRYTSMTGRTPQPPRWALGFHQSRWGYEDAARVEQVADELRRRSLPADVLWLDIQHHDRLRPFTFDPTRFPDPAGLTARLAARDFHVVAIADPGLAVAPGWSVYDEAVAGAHVLRRGDGSPHVDNAWPGPSVFPDFTSPGARGFWARQVAALAALGIDGIWLDVNEPTTFPESGGETTVPDTLAVAGDGQPSTMAEAHNAYATLQARATVDGLLAAEPTRRPFVLCRAGSPGVQRWAAVWTGDAPSSWTSLEGVLPMLLGMGLSGVPFVGSDVGGYSGRASPELYARWMEVGWLSPFFRAHVTQGVPGQEPWMFGQEVEDLARERLRARYALLPYLEALFEEHRTTGLPLLRALALERFEERLLRRVDDEAMLGPFLLVAPITREGASTREVVLPSGRWVDLESGALWDGPATIELGGTLAAIPMLAREGTILPRWSDPGQSARADHGELTFDLFPSPEETSLTLYEDDDDGPASGATQRVTLRGDERGARFRMEPRRGSGGPEVRSVVVRVLRVDGAVSRVALGTSSLAELSSRDAFERAERGWFADTNERALYVRLRADATRMLELEMVYDPTITELRPTVEVGIEVEVPMGTPTTTPIHIASDAVGWAHVPLAWTGPTTARGMLRVPRGAWFFYKFTRGSFETVEKWPGCAEATNRYRFGDARVRRDTVFGWRDWCP